MISGKYIFRIDWMILPVLFSLMAISLLVISSTDPASSVNKSLAFSPNTVIQIRHFILGIAVFFICATIDYNRFKDLSIILYVVMVLALLGLFFVPSIQNVHRWYRLPIIHMSIQVSEYAKVLLIISLSAFLESCRNRSTSLLTALIAVGLVFVPFVLIVKEPDLGTALILWPMALIMFYIGNINKIIVRILSAFAGIGLIIVLSIFLGLMSFETLQPVALKVIKEYQYERLNPDNHHQKASQISIGIGGVFGQGWRSGEFASRGWLPYGHTDSVFSAFGEEFGLVGLCILLLLFYILIYFGCKTTAVAKDLFGRILASGITVYMIIHVVINISMMCGLLPITGVPLILVSYGGSSIIATMSALGILQSIYSRRF